MLLPASSRYFPPAELDAINFAAVVSNLRAGTITAPALVVANLLNHFAELDNAPLTISAPPFLTTFNATASVVTAKAPLAATPLPATTASFKATSVAIAPTLSAALPVPPVNAIKTKFGI